MAYSLLEVHTDLLWKTDSENSCDTSTSADRKFFDAIWKNPMSQKVKIFIWKLARNGLGVQSNRMRQHLIPYATCSICGMEPENGHHAMVHCTFASSLRHALRRSWSLPDDPAFMYTGPDWILALLNSVTILENLASSERHCFWEWHVPHLIFS